MKIFSAISSKLAGVSAFLKKRWLRITALLIILIIGVVIYRRAVKEPAGLTVNPVYRMNLVSDFSANGQIKAKRQVDLKFYFPGRLTWVGVKQGDVVRSGQSVASINTTSLNAAYQQSLNNRRNSQAAAEQVLDVVQGHEKDETFAQRALRTTAEVNRDNSYETIIIARDNLRNALLVSPIAGTVVTTNDLVTGMNLSGADLETKFVRIVDLGSLYFEARVDEVDYAKIKEGQEVRINVDAYPNKYCPGTVNYIVRDGRETAGGVVTIPTEISISDCDLEFAAGLNGQAHFVLSKIENVLVIPKRYIVTKEGRDFVWKQTGSTPKTKELIPVKVGATNTSEAEIKEGLAEGDMVVFVP